MMTSKERVLTTLAGQEPDRVPINYAANGGIDLRMKAHFGLEKNDNEGLRRSLGGRLAFHGCISTAGPVASGDVENVKKYCKKTLEIMMPEGGYCFAPTHCLQDNSPTENVVEMYDIARKYGAYV